MTRRATRMLRRLGWAAALSVAAGSGAGAPPPAPTPRPAAFAPDMVAGPARVRDGDTLVVGRQPVRLQGLHCPELRDPGGREAAETMRRLVAPGEVSCALSDARSHDRRVGVCRAGDDDLAEALIRRGDCARCPRHDRDGRYAAAQRAAPPWRRGLPRYC
jgi:endonuclease YncB( thermonuclease family)